MGDRSCYRDFCPNCDGPVTVVDAECPDCGQELVDDSGSNRE